MGRRRKYVAKKKFGDNRGGGGPKKQKLNMRKLSTFEYLLRKALEDVESGGTIFGNVYSKSANIGIAEAINYVESLKEDGNLKKDKSGEVIDLLNRFSRFRWPGRDLIPSNDRFILKPL